MKKQDDNNSSSNSNSSGLLSSDSVWTPYIIMYSSYVVVTGACYLYERKMKKQGKVLLPKNRAQSYISMLAISRK